MEVGMMTPIDFKVGQKQSGQKRSDYCRPATSTVVMLVLPRSWCPVTVTMMTTSDFSVQPFGSAACRCARITASYSKKIRYRFYLLIQNFTVKSNTLIQFYQKSFMVELTHWINQVGSWREEGLLQILKKKILIPEFLNLVILWILGK